MHLIVGIAWLMWKLNARKYMCIINGNAVRGHLSENYLTQRFYRFKDFYTRDVYSTCKLCIYLHMCVYNFLLCILQNAAHKHTQAMCDSLHEEIKSLQHQLDELSQQQPSPHRVTVTHHTSTTHEGPADTTTSTQGTGGEGATRGDSSSTTMIFGSLSENLLLTILQRLQELYKEIHDGRAEGSSAAKWGERERERERE